MTPIAELIYNIVEDFKRRYPNNTWIPIGAGWVDSDFENLKKEDIPYDDWKAVARLFNRLANLRYQDDDNGEVSNFII